MPKNFAITGVGGYIAPRHLEAIRSTGNRLIAAVDPNDSVGILDQFSLDVRFFTEIERFDRHLEKLRRGPAEGRLDYMAVCSPNYLHDAHCRLAMRLGADVICEKPLVINPWNLDALQELEGETGCRIYTVLQLRLHEKLRALRESILAAPPGRKFDVVLSYITARGNWYRVSWKGSQEKSGGVATNIGIHFFDLLLWLFGPVVDVRVHLAGDRRLAGFIELERARVRWFLSVEASDLPFAVEPGRKSVHRSLTIDGQEVDFSEGFTSLHTRVYEEILAGRGFGIDDVRAATDLTYRIRTTDATAGGAADVHPILIN